MEIYYFIVGTQAVETFFENEDAEDWKTIAEGINYHGGDVIKHDPEIETPAHLADNISGWMEVASMTKEQYDGISKELEIIHAKK